MLASNEKWIAGYEDMYSVDTEGHVYTYRFGCKTKLKECNFTGGYLGLGLYKDGVRKNHHIHRLVAETFIPSNDSSLVVNHIDGNKKNNKLSNLEWCSISYNTKHAYKVGNAKGNGFKREVIRLHHGFVVGRYDSIAAAAEKTGINKTSISMVCNGRRKTAGNYEWRFAD